MAEKQHRKMTIEEFFEWQKRQDRNYELVDGVPVLPVKAMTGASDRRRDTAGSWDQHEAGLEAVIELPEIEAGLPLGELYRDLTFDEA